VPFFALASVRGGHGAVRTLRSRRRRYNGDRWLAMTGRAIWDTLRPRRASSANPKTLQVLGVGYFCDQHLVDAPSTEIDDFELPAGASTCSPTSGWCRIPATRSGNGLIPAGSRVDCSRSFRGMDCGGCDRGGLISPMAALAAPRQEPTPELAGYLGPRGECWIRFLSLRQ
jgi:hypothetical protein